MQRFITIQQTPTYRYDGKSYIAIGSMPVGTELTFTSIYKDANGRDVGLLADGKRMFIDTLSPLLEDKVQVTAKRMYLCLWIVGGLLAVRYGWQQYKKHKAKK